MTGLRNKRLHRKRISIPIAFEKWNISIHIAFEKQKIYLIIAFEKWKNWLKLTLKNVYSPEHR